METINNYRSVKKLILIIGLSFFISCQPAKTKIACVGDSITFGAFIENRERESYPAHLQRLLGDKYEVKNFGKNAATLLKKGDLPYVNTDQYQDALQYNPDIVFIKLGTNDSKKKNRVYLNDFKTDYLELIKSFKELPSAPRIVLLKPIPAFNYEDTLGITAKVIAEQIQPLIEDAAFSSGSEIIDLFHYFYGKDNLTSDKVHPNAEGAQFIANRIAEFILLETVSFNLLDSLKLDGEPYNFHGFAGIKAKYQNVKCRIIQPRHTAKGRPWIWRARFFGHEPQTDIALLERGFHLVFYDAANFFGAPQAVERWNRFYALMQKGGLANKVVLEGMSRGGLFIYNWAAANPEKVACIYADAPVLNIKSWPGGNKTSGTWKKCKEVYGFKNEAEARREKVSPIYHTKKIAEAEFPMLHIVGDADQVVPVAENTELFAREIKRYGGDIKVIHKPGVGHHPHSLKNPEQIIRFILQAVEQ